MAASLTVAYDYSCPRQTLFGYALRVRVTAASGMSGAIFIFQRGAAPAPAQGETVEDMFICIADPVDLHEIPESAPALDQEIPYYRLAEVTLAFRSIEERAATKATIEEDIRLLVRSVNLMEVFTSTDTVTYPEPGA